MPFRAPLLQLAHLLVRRLLLHFLWPPPPPRAVVVVLPVSISREVFLGRSLFDHPVKFIRCKRWAHNLVLMLLIRVVEYGTKPIPDRQPLVPLLMDGRWRTKRRAGSWITTDQRNSGLLLSLLAGTETAPPTSLPHLSPDSFERPGGSGDHTRAPAPARQSGPLPLHMAIFPPRRVSLDLT